MKLRIAIVLLLLAGGAIVNVAVAWAAALASQFETGSVTTRPTNLDESLLDDIDDWCLRSLLGERELEGVITWTHVTASVEVLLTNARSSWLRVWRISAGWPMAALSARVATRQLDRSEVRYRHALPTSVEVDDFFGFITDRSRVLPLKPLLPGFIINTLFYALLLWLLFAAPFAARSMIRRRRCLCEKCAYPIGVSPVCTECGAAVRPLVARSS